MTDKIDEYIDSDKSPEFQEYLEMLKTLPELDRDIEFIISELKKGRLV